MSAEVSVLPDAPGSYAGTIDFTFPDVQTLRFVNPDGTPATTGILDLSTDESRQRPDETFETVQTSLHWDLADGPAQMLVGGGDFRFTLNAGNGYSLEDPSIISSEPGGMLFTIPTVRTLHISGTAPPGDPSDPTSIQVLCGPDDNRVEVAEDGRYELELLTIDTAQCTLRLEAHVNETQVSISRPVTFINGFGTADFSIPDDLDVTVTDAEGSAVTDAVMYMSSSGELPMPDGVIATVVTDAQFGLDGSGPTTVSVVRAAEQGYQIQFDGGSRYSGTVNTLGETAVDIGLPPFARIEVTGAVHGWAAGHDGSVRMTCGGDSTTANVDVDGNYAAVLDTFVPPTCSLYLDAEADGTSIGELRQVTPGVVNNGVVSKSADFELPPLVTLHAVDSAEEPVVLIGWISSHAYSVAMPDGGVADVSTQVSGLSFTGSPQFARLTRTSGGWSYLTDGEEYQSEGDADWSGSGDMTFVALDPAPGAWVAGAPNASADGDGVTDVVEGLAPNSGDGNYDGIPDAEQADVTSLTASTGGYVTVALTEPPGAVFGPVAAVAPGTYPAPPAGVTLPNGLVGFEIDGLTPGETTRVRIYSSSAGDANGYAKWHDDQWEVLPSDRVTIDVTGGFVELTLTDGGMGDDDGIADGTIVDPGGLAVIADQQPPVIDCAPAPTVLVRGGRPDQLYGLGRRQRLGRHCRRIVRAVDVGERWDRDLIGHHRLTAGLRHGEQLHHGRSGHRAEGRQAGPEHRRDVAGRGSIAGPGDDHRCRVHLFRQRLRLTHVRGYGGGRRGRAGRDPWFADVRRHGDRRRGQHVDQHRHLHGDGSQPGTCRTGRHGCRWAGADRVAEQRNRAHGLLHGRRRERSVLGERALDERGRLPASHRSGYVGVCVVRLLR